MSGKVQNVNKAEKPKKEDKPSLDKAADKHNKGEQKSGHKTDESKPKIQTVDKKSEQKTNKQDESKPKIQTVDKKSEQKSGHKPEKHDESKLKIQKADKKGEQKSVEAKAKADKLKTPQINSEKHEQPEPKIQKVNSFKFEQEDIPINFQGNLYTLVESPPSPPNKPICHACTKPIPSSLYHCKAKGWNLHPLCSKLKTKVIDTTTTYTLVQTNDHCRIRCNWNSCKDKTNNSGLSYVSANKDRRFHAYCFMKLMVELSEKNCGHVREGLKREACLEQVLSLTNIFSAGFLGDITSIFDLMFA